MDEQSHQRAKKAIRYRVKAEDLRFEAGATAPGPSKEDKLSFADQWELLADGLETRA